MALTLELPPIFRTLQLPLLYLNLWIGIGLKPSFFRICATLPPLILLVSQSVYREEFQYYGVCYPLGVAAFCTIPMYFDQILLSNPDKEKWHKIQYGKKAGGGENGKNGGVPQTFLARMWWGVRYSTTNRFVGWSQQVKNVPMEVPADYPRWKFLVRKSLRAALFFVLQDIIQSYQASTPHGAYRGFENGKIIAGHASYPLYYRFLLSWLQIILTYTLLEFANAVYGIVSVLSGLANPRDCPSMFSDLRDMYTVRNSWSLVWHQQCRRSCSTPGIFLARDVLHLHKGGFASKYLQLFVGFAVSGFVHGGGAVLAKRSWSGGNIDMKFFILQAVAIMVEDHIVEFGKAIGFKDSALWRGVGYLWVVAWFGLSSIEYTSDTLDNGMWIHNQMYDIFGIGPKV